jgi:phage shock protein A
MADDAAKKGDEAKSGEFTTTAETIATRLIEIEREVEDLKALHLDNARAVEQAKSAVEQNSIALQEKLTERNKLLGQLDQAKMQEQMNSAMAQLSETVGQDVPTFDEVREKIEARYAKATGMAERIRSAKSASPRDENLSNRAADRTWAGTASSMAAIRVQRPSPESETRPAKDPSDGSPLRAWAVRSSSHEEITLPRRHTSATSAVWMS